MTVPLIFEGTWEEIASHEAELRGCRLRFTVLPEAPSAPSLEERRAFLKLPIAERRRLLAKQAEQLTERYASNTEWRDLQGGDIVEY